MASPKICVSVTAGDTEQAIGTIRELKAHRPDLIEIRLDYMSKPGNLLALREATEAPLIATNRRRDQGGLCRSPEQKRVGVLLEACEAGFDYIDLALTTPSITQLSDEIKSRGSRLIVSHHDFQRTPPLEELEEVLEKEASLGADVCKIVGTAQAYSDNLTYLSLLDRRNGVDLVCFAMGQAGVLSRVASPLLGGAFTYASSARGGEAAPGQLTLAEMRELYRLLGVSG